MGSMNNEPKFSLIERDTIVVTRKEIGQDFLHPEKVRLQLSDGGRKNPIDIGAFAYTVRQSQENSHLSHLPTKVCEDSFKLSRRDLLNSIHDYVATTLNRDSTVGTRLRDFANILQWIDSSGFSDAFDSESQSREAYKAWKAELKHRIQSADAKITPKTANEKQRELIKLFEIYWGTDKTKEIIREIPIIKFKRKEGEAPEERNVRFATKTFLNLARGLKHFVMSNESFPFLLKMPDYECYVFPSNSNSCITPYLREELFSYNYLEGRLSTAEEYKLKCPRNISLREAQRELDKAHNNLLKVNNDPRNINRLNYASLAIQSYMQLFILMTGIHRTELRQLKYDESFTLESDLLKNDFRAVKMRAGEREVAYHLGNRKGLEIFKEYIQLRNWLLNGVNCPYLFFTIDRNGSYTDSYSQLKSDNIYRVYRSVRGKFFPHSFKIITASQVRKYKTLVWNELNVAQEVIADSLNHTIKTNHKYYAVSSPEKQQEEFGLFFESAKAAATKILERKPSQKIPLKIIDGDTKSSENTNIASGHCDDFQHPEAMEDAPPIEPNCMSQIGCLYCEHYVCHADQEDIHKLYSLLYVIEAVREMATDFNHSDSLLLELNIRIKQVLVQISEKSERIKLLVENVREDVMEHGILTPFWEFRLERYEQMGVVV